MSVSSIGIQVIMPKTGTSPQQNSPQHTDDRDADEKPLAAHHAPPPPGTGKLVDKTV